MLYPLSEVPDLLQLHTCYPERYPFFIESVVHDTPQARYDILFACPLFKLCLQEGNIHIDPVADNIKDTFSSKEETEKNFFTVFDQYWQQESLLYPAMEAIDLPFQGGWFIYLGYESVVQIETSLAKNTPAHRSVPDACAYRIPAAIIYDHQQQRCFILAEKAEYLDIIQKDIAQQPPQSQLDRTFPVLSFLHEEDPVVFLNAVEKIKHYIQEGDVFQVNLSRQWQASVEASQQGDKIYQALRKYNPAPFAASVKLPNMHIVSSSPERLISVRKGIISARPIAGTHPRGNTPQADQQLITQLTNHPKERAEHIMLIDLIRNDLGRVSTPGSIYVDELMVVESYTHVHHIVSNVVGYLQTGMTPGQVLRAVFPGGTITGCPKVRCMEIIQELEQQARLAYTGSVGYVNHHGNMDLNILIRTLLVQDKQVSFRAGAGIVADSIAEKELSETRHKARGLLNAIGWHD